MILAISRRFEAAHFLPNYVGSCARLHGHSWRVDVEISGAIEKGTGMVADFKDLKRVIDEVLPDHRHLNEVFAGMLPTAENLAGLFYALIRSAVMPVNPELTVEKVTVWESDDCAAIYTRDDATYENSCLK